VKKFICLLLVFGFVTLCFAQNTRTPPASRYNTSALQSIVDTERAFAKMSEDQGIRPAFMAFIADDGILFRPTPVKGKQWMTEHPVSPSEKRPLLTWYPTAADISRDGDMGYTTGPWEYKADIHDAKAVAWGNFLTVWKRQQDKSWKFVIDLGISHPQPDQAATPWQLPNNYYEMKSVGGIGPSPIRDIKPDINALLAREREFSAASAARGPQKAFEEYAAGEVRLFRNGQPPIAGKADAVAALPASAVWMWEPVFADVSQSGDLGYSYGTYQLTKRDATLKTTEKVESGNYYRIWKRKYDILQGARWKIVTDLLDPVPADPKNN
jgi:ketosteroid isomerase-like protein